MTGRIREDHARFREIVQGKIRQDLGRYISHGEMIGRQGKDLVSIPVPQVEIPHFRHDERQTGGVGQGEGEPGTPLGPAQTGRGPGAGGEPGEHILEVDVSLEELAAMLGEELELPRIQPKGKKNIQDQKNRYTGISQTGPESLRHFRRTYKRALRRQLIAGQYDPRQPRIVPIRRDQQYRSWKVVPEPESTAVIFYLLDVSGSMGDEQKEIVRTAAFWIDTWISTQYQGIERRYIVHDVAAHEVDEETFYRVREGGGTAISSAYTLAGQLIGAHYSPEEWNIYGFHFSDGDNQFEDNRRAREVLEQELLPRLNQFAYGQVHSPYGSGAFMGVLSERFRGRDNIVWSEIKSRGQILDCLKAFLGKGR